MWKFISLENERAHLWHGGSFWWQFVCRFSPAVCKQSSELRYRVVWGEMIHAGSVLIGSWSNKRATTWNPKQIPSLLVAQWKHPGLLVLCLAIILFIFSVRSIAFVNKHIGDSTKASVAIIHLAHQIFPLILSSSLQEMCEMGKLQQATVIKILTRN